MDERRDRPPPRPPTEDDELKPDILERNEQPIGPAEALRRERETYGDDSTFPNRDDIEDEHAGAREDSDR